MTRSAYESRFDRHVGALRTFVAREQHCNVPYAHIEAVGDEQVPLGRWVAYVRSRQRHGNLAHAQQVVLEAVPYWSWERRRPGPTAKAARNAEIRSLRAEKVSLAMIAETYGLSKQRVFQIARETRLSPRTGHSEQYEG